MDIESLLDKLSDLISKRTIAWYIGDDFKFYDDEIEKVKQSILFYIEDIKYQAWVDK